MAPLHMVEVGHLLRGWSVVHLAWLGGGELLSWWQRVGEGQQLGKGSFDSILFSSALLEGRSGGEDSIYRPGKGKNRRQVHCARRLTVGHCVPTCQWLFSESVSSFFLPQSPVWPAWISRKMARFLPEYGQVLVCVFYVTSRLAEAGHTYIWLLFRI